MKVGALGDDEGHQQLHRMPGFVAADVDVPAALVHERLPGAVSVRPAAAVVAVVEGEGAFSDDHQRGAGGTAGLAYLLKDRVGDLDALLRALREVCAGGSVIDPIVVESLVDRRARLADSPLETLTPRETDVLRAMAQGGTNTAIAEALVLSRSAVESTSARSSPRSASPRRPASTAGWPPCSPCCATAA